MKHNQEKTQTVKIGKIVEMMKPAVRFQNSFYKYTKHNTIFKEKHEDSNKTNAKKLTITSRGENYSVRNEKV